MVNSHWKPYVSSWPTRSNTQKISSFSEATMSAHPSTESMVSTMNVSYSCQVAFMRKNIMEDMVRRAVYQNFKRRFFAGKRRYNIKLWKTFTDCFNCLPVAAIVDEKIFCCHGGLSPDLQSMEQIRRIMRPTDVPDQGLLCDLLWSDPDKVRLPY